MMLFSPGKVKMKILRTESGEVSDIVCSKKVREF